MLDVLRAPRFVDRAPRAIVATLLEEGRYLCSASTMYRLLRKHREVHERRNQRRHPNRPAPVVEATAPNQAWVWDVTKLRGPVKGSFFFLAVILDLFSRRVMAWTCQTSESAAVAVALFHEATTRYAIQPHTLVVHADRGAAMTSKDLATLFDGLGVSKSHSRPRCSNDNPHQESFFKTAKYAPGYPGSFATIAAAREYFGDFFPWYNTQHRHAALAFLTPEAVYSGATEDLVAKKQAALDAAYAEHPERFPRGRPLAPRLPDRVSINPAARRAA